MRSERETTQVIRTWLVESLDAVPAPDRAVTEVLRRLPATPQAQAPHAAPDRERAAGASGTRPGAGGLRRRGASWSPGPAAPPATGRTRGRTTPGLIGAAKVALTLAAVASASVVGFALRGEVDPAASRAIVSPGQSGPRTLIVDGRARDGYLTIGSAIADARDGDTILVRPGTYAEHVALERRVTLSGDGPMGSVILRAPAASGDAPPVALHLRGSDATVSDLTITGPEVASAIVVDGGAPTLRRLDVDLDGEQAGRLPRSPHENLVIDQRSRARVEDSTFDGFITIGGGSPVTFEGNRVVGGCVWVLGVGSDATIRDTSISDSRCPTFAIGVKEGARPLVEGNTIDGGALYGIEVAGRGSDPVVRANTIRSVPIGMWTQSEAAPVITGNLIEGTETGLSISWTAAIVRDNVVRSNDVGVSVFGASDPELTGNRFESNGIGYRSDGPTHRVDVTGGAWCDNGQDIEVISGREPALVDAGGCDGPSLEAGAS